MAERYGSDLRRWLRSAERFSDAAIFLGSFMAKTFCWRSSASLCLVTSLDQRVPGFRRAAAEHCFFVVLLRSPGWGQPGGRKFGSFGFQKLDATVE